MVNKQIEIKFSYDNFGQFTGFGISVTDRKTKELIKATVLPYNTGVKLAQQASFLVFNHVCRNVLGLNPELERQKLMQEFIAETNGTNDS
jgi:hypothetical protein